MNKGRVMDNVLEEMKGVLNQEQLSILRQSLENSFEDEHKQDIYTNEELVAKFRREKQFKGCKEASINNYCNAVIKLYRTLDKALTEITSEELNEYMIDYSRDHKVKETSLNNMKRYLSSFFGYLANKQIIPINIATNIPNVKVPVIIRQSYTDRELEMIKDAVKDNIRNRAIFEVLDNTGLRISELCNLNRDSFDNGQIIIGKGNKQRKIFFPDKCKYWVDRYLDSRTDTEEALFVNERMRNGYILRISKHSVENICADLSKRLCIYIHPHKFRRTFCTRLLSRGMSIDMVMYIMGHSSADTTMIYRSIADEEVIANLKKYN